MNGNEKTNTDFVNLFNGTLDGWEMIGNGSFALLVENASTMPLTQTDRLLLDSKRANVAVELRMFNLAHTIEKELNRVILRLDKLESFLFNDFSGSRVPRQLSEPSLPPSPPSPPSPTSEPSPASIPQP